MAQQKVRFYKMLTKAISAYIAWHGVAINASYIIFNEKYVTRNLNDISKFRSF